jgi:hypothetical protein
VECGWTAANSTKSSSVPGPPFLRIQSLVKIQHSSQESLSLPVFGQVMITVVVIRVIAIMLVRPAM